MLTARLQNAAPLQDCPNLRAVSLSSALLDRVDAFGRCAALEDLSLSGVLGVVDWAPLGGAEKLRRLRVHRSRLTGLGQLGTGLTSLTDLDLAGNNFLREGFGLLGNFPHLASLNVAHSNMTGIEEMPAAHPALAFVNVSGCRFVSRESIAAYLLAAYHLTYFTYDATRAVPTVRIVTDGSVEYSMAADGGIKCTALDGLELYRCVL